MSSADRWRHRVIDRLWATWEPRDRTEWELKSISLRLIGMSKDGVPELSRACWMALGLRWERWIQADSARRQAQQTELASIIPDYDPADGPLAPIEIGRIL